MTIFVLVFILFSKASGPQVLAGGFGDRFSCQIAEEKVATVANADKNLSGWVIVGEPCAPVQEGKKV